MNKIDAIISGLTAFSENLGKALPDYVHENEHEIIQRNIEQMRLGLMPNGDEIRPSYPAAPDNPSLSEYYQGTYAQFKRYGDGNRYDLPERSYLTPNLGLSGSFYRSIVMLYEGEEEIQVTATNRKWDDAPSENHDPLHTRYGDVLGIPEYYIQDIMTPAIKENLIKQLRDIL